MAIQLGDDGTLDPGVFCTECGEELRGTGDGGARDDGHGFPVLLDGDSRDDFVEWMIADVTAEHECPKVVN